MTAGDSRPSFVDTNVFVYAVVDDDPERRQDRENTGDQTGARDDQRSTAPLDQG